MGIPCVTSSAENIKSIQNLLQENPDIQMTLDLESLKVKCGHYSSAIKIDSGARNMLVTGKWDTCSLLIKNISQIKNTAEKLPYLAW